MPRLFLLALALAVAPALQASLSLDTEYRTAGPAVRAAFDFVQPRLQQSSAVFQRGRKELIFGTVVSRDGHILTKASELESLEGVSVVIGAETYDDPKLLATDPSWDVALVKIDAENLVPVDLSMDELPPQGTWLIANGATERDKRRVQVGVMAAKAREVFAAGGTVLGISLKEEEGALVVEEVTEDRGAEATD
jgi:S1-C subfamily serine protease